MSILFAAASTTAPAVETWISYWLAVAAPLALVLAIYVGVFRRRRSSDRGLRFTVDEPVMTLWMIALATVFVWISIGAVYGAYVQLSHGTPTTSAAFPTTEPEFSVAELLWLTVSSSLAGLAAMLAMTRLLRPRGFELLGLTLARLGEGIRYGVIGALIVIPLMFAVTLLIEQGYKALHYEHPPEHELLKALGEVADPRMKLLIIVSALVLAPAVEEVLFRGYIQTAVLASLWRLASRSKESALESPPRRWQRWIAIVIASIAFAAIHGQFWMMPPIFFLSLCLGYAYERTGNLWVTITIHASFNAASTALFLLTR